ncbi:MAG: haloacid dehalogenase-like hydrolase, partial [Ignavibacteria bacterium]|nr:haloacid dehalogenase-like hydrolase [Ignavibacteria bacterium]
MKKILLILILLSGICFTSCENGKKEVLKNNSTSSKSDIVYLNSWADEPRQKIEAWVKSVTDSSSRDYIPVADRIAVFDNDGTLWPEQPLPIQIVFAIDNLRLLAPKHPEWQQDSVLNGVITNNFEPLKKSGAKGLKKLVDASHNGMTEDEFSTAVQNWINTARDMKFKKPYTELVYKPMIELLSYLKANGFTNFIVSGGGADFMRVWTEKVYDIPPYRVIGSYGNLNYEITDGKPVITKLSGDIYADNKEGKPVAIHRFIGKVPVFCGGNSDGDQAMMQYTSGSKYKSFCLLIHHTDSVREYKYDLVTLSGHLET